MRLPCRKRCCVLVLAVAAVALAIVLLVHSLSEHRPVYSSARATQFAKLAGASYCSANDLATWSCGIKCLPGVSSVHVCQGGTTKAFVALFEGQCIVSTMGTQEYSAFATDLEFYKQAVSWDGCADCQVHDGFLGEWQSLETCVTASLLDAGCPKGSGIRVTGHSLGGAVSGLAMMSLDAKGWKVSEAYTFGMPRTGDERFAADFNQRFKGVFFRVTHHMDPVVQLPPDQLITNWHFQHVEPEAFYDDAVGSGHSMCSKDGDSRCSGQYNNVLTDLLHIGDHMVYMDLEIGTVGCKASLVNSSASLPRAPGPNATAGLLVLT